MESYLQSLIDHHPPITVDLHSALRAIDRGVDDNKPDLDYVMETLAARSLKDPGCGILAARIYVDRLHRATPGGLRGWLERLSQHQVDGIATPLLNPVLLTLLQDQLLLFESMINYERDYRYDYFALKTLERTYLTTINNKVVERPQQMLLRVALEIHRDQTERVIQCYEEMSNLLYTHATPTMINSGTNNNQLASCFLLTMKSDSIEGIYDTLKQTAILSKGAGGVGLDVTPIRAAGSYIRGTNGRSNGLVPMLKVYNDTARYVDQGGGKRKGAFAIYLEPWHSDIFEWLDLRKNTGKDEQRARDLHQGLWIPDLFMQRVVTDGEWSLFCPHECPHLLNVYDDGIKNNFTKVYLDYERAGRARTTIKAVELWQKILDLQLETGEPYLLYKDACNRKSNQKHSGIIHSSNLCTEIMENTTADQVAVCNLASLSLPAFVTTNNEATITFDHQLLYRTVKNLVDNMNNIIDNNKYPLPETRQSNLTNRPMGIGIQGLAETFLKLGHPFLSLAAKRLNREIMETIYFAAVERSAELARERGRYDNFTGSPLSEGLFQFDLWDEELISDKSHQREKTVLSGRWDWRD